MRGRNALGGPGLRVFHTHPHSCKHTRTCKQKREEKKIGATKSPACLRDGLRSPRRYDESIEFAAFPARERAKDRENRERQTIETSCAYRFAPTASWSRPPRARFFHRSLKTSIRRSIVEKGGRLIRLPRRAIVAASSRHVVRPNESGRAPSSSGSCARMRVSSSARECCAFDRPTLSTNGIASCRPVATRLACASDSIS